MVRLGGRSRGNKNDPPGEYVDEQQLYPSAIPAFPSSSAAAAASGVGGVTSMPMPPAFSSTPGGGGTTRKQQQKSMTSGISTLFRRQPSPDIQIQQMQQVNSSSNYGGSGSYTNPGRIAAGSTTRTAASAQARTSTPPRQPTINDASYSPAQLMLLHGTGTTIGGAAAAATTTESGVGGRRRHFITKDRSVSFENINDDDDIAPTIPNNITSSESNDDGMLYGDNIIRSEEDDNDDDYGSNIAARDYRHQQPRRSNNNNTNRNHRSSKSPKRTSKQQQQQQVLRLPRRYRGFSTSISSLFLDESIVCGAVSCCGLLLASRTEHLLDERNAKIGLTRRGVGGEAGRGKEGGRRAPSRVLGVAWVITTLGVLSTYAIWGFDTGAQNGGDDYEYDYDYSYYDDGDFNGDEGDDEYYDDDGGEYDDANNRRLIHGTKSRGLDNNLSSTDVPPNRHEFSGIMKVRDYREHIFDPAMDMTNQVFVSLMAQFDADEYIPQHRYLEDSSSSTTSTSSNSYVHGQQARAILIVLFLLLLGIIGRRRRMRTRFAILRARAQDDHLYYASILTKKNGASGSLATPDNTIMENFHEREDQYDGACSHTLLGCYPVDTIMPDYADYNEDDEDQTLSTAGTTKRGRKGGDFMGRTTTMILNCCCGRLCKCWCQLFSSCALAQEARETRLLLPPSMQRVDLMTHQPFQEYAKDVNNLRMKFMEKTNRTWLQHYSALSHLSRYILVGFILIMVFVLTTLLSHPTGRFGWGDAVVLIATFSQSFLVLFIVFGIFHRSDLSFDAVIKFFAVGFCICVSVGFILEAVLINSMLSIMYFLYYLLDWTIGENFQDWMTDNYRFVSIFSELINAYFVAALVEELCKYYGFRFVEHPDLLFLTGLDRTAKQAKSSGGLDAYKYDSQLISNFSSDHGCDSESLDSRGRRKMSKKKLNRNSGDDEDEVEPELRTLQQQAAAITTGMISVAVGLACAENCLYVFLLGGAGGSVVDMSVRLCILLFRSVFPIHALGAAMQSINMIRKFIEEKHGGERNIGVGRIIFPAVLLHGTFDAILMSVNAYIEASYESYYENGGNGDEIPFNAVAVNLIACLGIIGVMAVSFGWYSHQNKMQMLRLAMFDMSRAGSGLGGFHAPSIV